MDRALLPGTDSPCSSVPTVECADEPPVLPGVGYLGYWIATEDAPGWHVGITDTEALAAAGWSVTDVLNAGFDGEPTAGMAFSSIGAPFAALGPIGWGLVPEGQGIAFRWLLEHESGCTAMLGVALNEAPTSAEFPDGQLVWIDLGADTWDAGSSPYTPIPGGGEGAPFIHAVTTYSDGDVTCPPSPGAVPVVQPDCAPAFRVTLEGEGGEPLPVTVENDEPLPVTLPTVPCGNPGNEGVPVVVVCEPTPEAQALNLAQSESATTSGGNPSSFGFTGGRMVVVGGSGPDDGAITVDGVPLAHDGVGGFVPMMLVAPPGFTLGNMVVVATPGASENTTYNVSVYSP